MCVWHFWLRYSADRSKCRLEKENKVEEEARNDNGADLNLTLATLGWNLVLMDQSFYRNRQSRILCCTPMGKKKTTRPTKEVGVWRERRISLSPMLCTTFSSLDRLTCTSFAHHKKNIRPGNHPGAGAIRQTQSSHSRASSIEMSRWPLGTDLKSFSISLRFCF